VAEIGREVVSGEWLVASGGVDPRYHEPALFTKCIWMLFRRLFAYIMVARFAMVIARQ
jgi:hypothetical protein